MPSKPSPTRSGRGKTNQEPIGAPGGDSFDVAASERIRSTQAAWLELLGEIDLSGARPTAIAQRLGVDKTLAWKMARFMGEESSGKAFRYLPGETGVEILLRAVSDQGVVQTRIEATRQAVTDLRAFIREQAGDRRAFEAMVTSNHREGKAEIEHRRQLFRANSAIWGVRASMQTLTIILRPSETEKDKLDVVQLGGLIELERLRTDLPWIVRRLRASNDSDSSRFAIKRVPLDAEHEGPPLFRSYCSTPMPRLRQFLDETGWVYDELVPGAVGKSGAVTCILAEKHLAVLPMRRSAENTAGRYTVTVRTPVEGVLFDVLLHKDLQHFGDAEMRTYGLLEGRPTAGGGTLNSIPLYEPEPAQKLGSPAIVQSGRLPWYAGMVREAISRAGWGSLSDYRGYRMDIEYPAIPCDLTLVCEIGGETP